MKLHPIHALAFAAVLISTIQRCQAGKTFVPLSIGKHFATPFGDTDLLRGFKQNRKRGESAFKDKVFTGTYHDRPFATEFVRSFVIKDLRDVEDYMGIEGSLKITYGPAEGKGSGSFLSENIKSKKRVRAVYTRRSAVYAKSVDLETLQPSPTLVDVCEGPCVGKTNKIAKHFGTKFVDQVVYGSQIDFVYTVKSDEDIDITKIGAEIEGKIGLSKLTVDFSADFSMINENKKTKYKVDIECRASGVNFAVPSNPDFEQVSEIIGDFNAAYEEILEGLSSFENIDEETNVLREVSPIGFTLAAISDYLPAMDEMKAAALDMKMTELSKTFMSSLFKREELANELKAVRKEVADDNPRFRDERFLPYRQEVAKLIGKLDDILEACLEYRKKPLEEIIDSDTPKGFGEGVSKENEINEAIFNGLLGQGYVAPPVIFGDDRPVDLDLYYTGYALPYNDTETGQISLRPHLSGVVYNDTTEEFIADGNTTDEVYKNYVATLPVTLPPHHIGYRTPFMLQVTNMYLAKQTDPSTEVTYARTLFGKDFCKEERDGAELQFLARPEDVYDDDDNLKTSNECVKYGDSVYIALADADGMDKVFLTPGDGSDKAEMIFENPVAKEGAFKFKVQSAIPFDKDFNSPIHDALVGQCVDITKGPAVFLQSEKGQRWIAGANEAEPPGKECKVTWYRKYCPDYSKLSKSDLSLLSGLSKHVKKAEDDDDDDDEPEDYDLIWAENIFVDKKEDIPQYKWRILSFETAWADNKCKAEKAPPKRMPKVNWDKIFGRKNSKFLKIANIKIPGVGAGFKKGSGIGLGKTSGSKPGFLPSFKPTSSQLIGGIPNPKPKSPTPKPFTSSTKEFSDGRNGSKGICEARNGKQSYLTAVTCRGQWCDNIVLNCFSNGVLEMDSKRFDYPQGNAWTKLSGTSWAFCAKDSNQVVTGMACKGGYCGQIKVFCQALSSKLKLDYDNCKYTAPITSAPKKPGSRAIPPNSFVIGVRCEGTKCETKRLRYCFPQNTKRRLSDESEKNDFEPTPTNPVSSPNPEKAAANDLITYVGGLPF